MKKLISALIMPLLFVGCSYRSDDIKDNGVWVPVPIGESVMGYDNIGGKIYWGYIVGMDFTEDECLGADIETFRVCKGTEYARDKHRVYYPHDEICYDGVDCGGVVAEKIVLDGANPSRFRYIGDGYAVSGNQMYLNGGKIEWNDSIIQKGGSANENMD